MVQIYGLDSQRKRGKIIQNDIAWLTVLLQWLLLRPEGRGNKPFSCFLMFCNDDCKVLFLTDAFSLSYTLYSIRDWEARENPRIDCREGMRTSKNNTYRGISKALPFLHILHQIPLRFLTHISDLFLLPLGLQIARVGRFSSHWLKQKLKK